jgi:hypothetical protein
MPVANEVIFVRHLGYHKDSYTPTLRGFDHFLGYYSGAEEHFTHMKGGIRGDGKMVNFYDLANNTGGTLSRAGSGIAPHVVGNRSWDDGLYSAYLYGNETARYIRQHDPAVRGSAPTLTRALGHHPSPWSSLPPPHSPWHSPWHRGQPDRGDGGARSGADLSLRVVPVPLCMRQRPTQDVLTFTLTLTLTSYPTGYDTSGAPLHLSRLE